MINFFGSLQADKINEFAENDHCPFIFNFIFFPIYHSPVKPQQNNYSPGTHGVPTPEHLKAHHWVGNVVHTLTHQTVSDLCPLTFFS